MNPLLIPLLEGAKNIIAGLVGGKLKKEEAEAQLAVYAHQAEQELLKGQLEINKIEAASDSLFKSGWRPAVGWVCVIALFYQFLLRPLLPWAFAAAGHPLPEMPDLGENLWELMFGMLGLGGLRSFERVRGKA